MTAILPKANIAPQAAPEDLSIASQGAVSPLALNTVLSKLRSLPSLPAAVMELLRTMGDEDIDIETIARKLSQDQALAAKTLRLANSSFYGRPRQVTSVQEAIRVLGLRSVRTLVTAAALTSGPSFRQLRGFDFRAFWMHCIAVAICARALARQLASGEEFAFTAGLLHDIGRLALASAFPDEYVAVLAHRATQNRTMLQAERDVLGIDHAAAGQALAEHWKFPATIVEAVTYHHAPDRLGGRSLATIVHVADALVKGRTNFAAIDDPAPQLSSTLLADLALTDENVGHALSETEKQLGPICQILLA